MNMVRHKHVFKQIKTFVLSAKNLDSFRVFQNILLS